MAKKEKIKNKPIVGLGQRLVADHRGRMQLTNEYQLFCAECGAEAGILGSSVALLGEQPVQAICYKCEDDE